MKLSEQQQRFARDVAKLIKFINDQGFSCTFGEAFRTQEQAALYAAQGLGIEDSLHCKRLAIDLNLFNEHGDYLPNSTLYKPFGDYWESLDSMNKWGGKFKRADGNHFERKQV